MSKISVTDLRIDDAFQRLGIADINLSLLDFEDAIQADDFTGRLQS